MLNALAAALCWGLATVLSKAALGAFQPVTLLVLQLAASVLCLWTVVWCHRLARPAWSDVKTFAWLGLLEPGLAFLLALTGLSDTGAGAATLITASESIMIVVVSAVVLRERPGRRFVLCSLIALFGLLTALGVTGRDAALGTVSASAWWIVAGTAVAAVYVVLTARIATCAHPIYIIACQQTVALAFAVVILLLRAPSASELPADADTWLLAAVSGVIQYAVAFTLYMQALRTVSASTAGSFLNLTPLFGLLGAVAFLHERLAPVQLLGAGITLAALMVISGRDATGTR